MGLFDKLFKKKKEEVTAPKPACASSPPPPPPPEPKKIEIPDMADYFAGKYFKNETNAQAGGHGYGWFQNKYPPLNIQHLIPDIRAFYNYAKIFIASSDKGVGYLNTIRNAAIEEGQKPGSERVYAHNHCKVYNPEKFELSDIMANFVEPENYKDTASLQQASYEPIYSDKTKKIFSLLTHYLTSDSKLCIVDEDIDKVRPTKDELDKWSFNEFPGGKEFITALSLLNKEEQKKITLQFNCENIAYNDSTADGFKKRGFDHTKLRDFKHETQGVIFCGKKTLGDHEARGAWKEDYKIDPYIDFVHLQQKGYELVNINEHVVSAEVEELYNQKVSAKTGQLPDVITTYDTDIKDAGVIHSPLGAVMTTTDPKLMKLLGKERQ